MPTRRTFLKAAGAVPLAAWLSACGSGDKAAGGSALTVITSAEATTLDPTFGYSTPDWNYLLQVFDPLIYRDSSNQLWGRLAETWEWKDSTTFTMHLRKGVKFHSGTAFDASAVQVSFERMFSVQTQNRAATSDIPYAGLDVIDDYTVDLKLKEPTPLLAQRLRLVLILDPTVYQGSKDPIQDPAKISGTGAYRVTSYTRGGKFELAANDDYWDEAPVVKKAVIRAVPEASTRVSELLAGSADVIQGVPIDQVQQIQSSSKVELLQAPTGRDNMLTLTCSRPPFDNLKARLAVNYAVDKDSINKNLLGGFAEVYGGIAMPPNDNPDVKPYPYDPDKARALLREAGVDGQQITIQTTTGRYVREKEICEAIASYLTDAGLPTKVETVDFSVLEAARQNGSTKEATFQALGGFFDGEGELRWALDSISRNGWKDETFESKLAELGSEMDDDKRKPLVNELQQYVHEQAPWLFLWRQPSLYAQRTGVKFEARPDENFLLAQVREGN